MARRSGWQELPEECDPINTRKRAHVSTTYEPIHTRPRYEGRTGESLTRHNNRKTEVNPWLKNLSLLGLLLTTAVSTSVLVGLLRGWRITGQVYYTITSSRATTQFIISIFSNFLGGTLVAISCQLVNRATRLALSRPTSLDSLAFWYALSTKSLDWHLGPSLLPFLVTFNLASAGASPLRTATLTPIPTTYNWTQSVPLDLPQYTNNSYHLWSQSILVNVVENATVSNNKGQFSYLPLQDRLGYLLTDGSVASSVDWRPAQHTKNDNSNFTYIGRSFGVGSSVGLTDDATAKKDGTVAYFYTESGYYTNVECIRNVSSDFHLMPLIDAIYEPGWAIPASFLATGSGPNSTEQSLCDSDDITACGGMVTVGVHGTDDIVAAAWWASFESGLADAGLPQPWNYIEKARPVNSSAFTSLAAGKHNQNLDNVQCRIRLVPALFNVDVDVLERSIQVKLLSNTSQQDIEPTGFIADSASSILGTMTLVDTTVYTSIMGAMLNRNIDNVKQQKNLTAIDEDSTLQGVSETLEALIDDYLIAIGSAQLLVAKDTLPVYPRVVSHALNVGQKPYVIATFLINVLMIFLYVIEAIRTRLWDKLPEFDYVNIKSVVAASSRGGSGVGEKVQSQLDGMSDRLVGRVRVLLEEDEGPMLRLAYRGEGEEDGGTWSVPLEEIPSKIDGGDSEIDEVTTGQHVGDSPSPGGARRW